MKIIKGLLVLCLVTAMLFSVTNVMAVVPYGATITEEKSETAPADSPGSDEAIAGNVTELTIFGYSTTQSWQGYFGNVSGTIQLADANDNVMYNWSLASPEGEVYAANQSVTWTHIQCFNFTADGTFADDSAQAGATSLYGMNLSQLESLFDIAPDDVDGVDETFSLIGPGTHDLFYTNNLEFSEGECRNTRIYSDAGKGENDKFEEVLLYDPDNKIVVFTSILDEEDVAGFDDAYHDFEMLVLENGHGTDTQTTTYYFYVELE